MTTQDWIDAAEGDILAGTVEERSAYSERWLFPEHGVMIDAVPRWEGYYDVAAYVLQDDGIYYPISEPAKNGWRTKRVKAGPDPRAIVAAGLSLLS